MHLHHPFSDGSLPLINNYYAQSRQALEAERWTKVVIEETTRQLMRMVSGLRLQVSITDILTM